VGTPGDLVDQRKQRAILVGNCSWTDPTLIACGRFYPHGVKSAADRLRFYATQFPIVEVDSTFYGPPSDRNARLWVERTPPRFVFDIKAFALLTGHGASPERLPPELRALLPADAPRKRNVYLRDLPSEGEALLYEIHRRALAPLHEAGKLGALLFQFPPWFRAGHAGREHIRKVVAELDPFPIAVEFRGGGWLSDESGVARTLSFLESLGVAYVAVDEPQGFANSTPPIAVATADLAVVRFHGRNRDTWEIRGGAASDRFNYLYDRAELAVWAPQVRALAERAATVHVLFNNNYQDYGVRNARQMAALLGLEGGSVPGTGPVDDGAPGHGAPGHDSRDEPHGQTSLL
jgi:uncharacterized protein YecE (DUF72 family)